MFVKNAIVKIEGILDCQGGGISMTYISPPPSSFRSGRRACEVCVSGPCPPVTCRDSSLHDCASYRHLHPRTSHPPSSRTRSRPLLVLIFFLGFVLALVRVILAARAVLGFPSPWLQPPCFAVCLALERLPWRLSRTPITSTSARGVAHTSTGPSGAYFTHEPPYAYLPLFMSSWNMQDHWKSDLFCFGDGQIRGVFPATFAFCIKALGLATFFIAPKDCIF